MLLYIVSSTLCGATKPQGQSLPSALLRCAGDFVFAYNSQQVCVYDTLTRADMLLYSAGSISILEFMDSVDQVTTIGDPNEGWWTLALITTVGIVWIFLGGLWTVSRTRGSSGASDAGWGSICWLHLLAEYRGPKRSGRSAIGLRIAVGGIKRSAR